MREFELSGEGTCNIWTAGAGAKKPRSKRLIKQDTFINERGLVKQ